ncbi:MAG: voltage-gated potassium channel [Rickettsiales bacterium]|jgi:voltage-gated potassium channel
MLFGYRYRKFSSKSSSTIIKSSSTKKQFYKLLVLLFAILTLHVVAMIMFEGLATDDAIWLTMTSATTVGYGDFSAKTANGRIATILLLYIGGIAILTQVFATYFEYKQEIKHKMLTGNWSWNMKNHIIFMNCPDDLGEEYFYRAILGLRKSCAKLSKMPIIIVSEGFKDGLPHDLQKLDVVQISKSASSNEALDFANVNEAHTIVILSKNPLDATSDSINFDLVDRLRERGVKARIIAEVVKDTNRPRVKKAGANNVLRPIRAYPELLMRSIISPGSEQVIETIFDSFGEECIRYDVTISCRWLDVIYKLAEKDLGIPVAYEDVDGVIFNAPSSAKIIDAKAIFAIVHEGYTKSNQAIEDILTSAEPAPEISFFNKYISKIAWWK